MSTKTQTPVVEPVDCDCYKCAEPVHKWVDGRRVTVNNVHGRLEACEQCGRAKTEYVDLGRKGVYRCWWCEKRAAEFGDLN